MVHIIIPAKIIEEYTEKYMKFGKPRELIEVQPTLYNFENTVWALSHST